MTLKDPKQIIHELGKKYIKREDNLINAERMFIVNSVIQKMYSELKSEKIDKTILLEYSILIEKCLKKEVDISWKDGKLFIVPADNRSIGD